MTIKTILESIGLFIVITVPSESIIINGLDPECNYTVDPDLNFDKCIEWSADYFCTITPDEQKWLQSLYNKATQKTGIVRHRREIRTLSKRDRDAFFKAVNALKTDTVICFSIYPIAFSLSYKR